MTDPGPTPDEDYTAQDRDMIQADLRAVRAALLALNVDVSMADLTYPGFPPDHPIQAEAALIVLTGMLQAVVSTRTRQTHHDALRRAVWTRAGHNCPHEHGADHEGHLHDPSDTVADLHDGGEQAIMRGLLAEPGDQIDAPNESLEQRRRVRAAQGHDHTHRLMLISRSAGRSAHVPGMAPEPEHIPPTLGLEMATGAAACLLDHLDAVNQGRPFNPNDLASSVAMLAEAHQLVGDYAQTLIYGDITIPDDLSGLPDATG